MAVIPTANDWTNVGEWKLWPDSYLPLSRPDSLGKGNLCVNGEAQCQLGGSEIELDSFHYERKCQEMSRDKQTEETRVSIQLWGKEKRYTRGVRGVSWQGRQPNINNARDSSDTAFFNPLTGNVNDLCKHCGSYPTADL